MTGAAASLPQKTLLAVFVFFWGGGRGEWVPQPSLFIVLPHPTPLPKLLWASFFLSMQGRLKRARHHQSWAEWYLAKKKEGKGRKRRRKIGLLPFHPSSFRPLSERHNWCWQPLLYDDVTLTNKHAPRQQWRGKAVGHKRYSVVCSIRYSSTVDLEGYSRGMLWLSNLYFLIFDFSLLYFYIFSISFLSHHAKNLYLPPISSVGEVGGEGEEGTASASRDDAQVFPFQVP